MHTPHLLLVDMSRNKNEVEFNASRLSVLGLFGFRNVTYTTFLFTCINILLVKSKVKTWRKIQRGTINQ